LQRIFEQFCKLKGKHCANHRMAIVGFTIVPYPKTAKKMGMQRWLHPHNFIFAV